MKKIFMVIPTLGDGGGERLVVDLSIKLQNKGYNVYLVSLYDKINSINTEKAVANNLNIIYLKKKLGLDISLFFKVRKILRLYKPDIIHTHLDAMLYFLPFYNKKIRKFHTVHSIAQKEASGLQKIIRIIAFKIKKVIPVAISNSIAKTVAYYYKINLTEIPVVYNGIDTSKYYRFCKQDKQLFTLINVGTLYEVKNQMYLIDAFAMFNKKHTNSQLFILGDGPLKDQLQNKIESLQLVNKVHLVGKVTNVWDYLAKSDVFVVTSKYEGLPLSMLEAMASGLPIISSNVGGIEDVLKDNINGFLYDLNNIDILVDYISLLYCNSEIRKKMSETNFMTSKRYDIEIMSDNYVKLYEE